MAFRVGTFGLLPDPRDGGSILDGIGGGLPPFEIIRPSPTPGGGVTNPPPGDHGANPPPGGPGPAPVPDEPAAVVPIPPAGVLLLSGLALLAARTRRSGRGARSSP